MKSLRHGIVAAALVLVGCAGPSPSPTPTSAGPHPATWGSLLGHAFVSTSVTQRVPALVDLPPGSLKLRFEELAASGPDAIVSTGGCNWSISPGGQGDREPTFDSDGVLHIPDGFVTPLAGCIGGNGNVRDGWFMHFLASSPRVTIDGTTITLASADAVIAMVDTPSAAR